MRIGLTYDLRKEYLEIGFSEEETAEFDSDETISSIEESLAGMSHETVRIGNIYELIRRLSLGERWDLVFNLSEGLYGRSREAQVPAVLEAHGIPYTFSDPLTLSVCLDKSVAKRIAASVGVPTPRFRVVSDGHELSTLFPAGPLSFPLFVKPLWEGTSKGIDGTSIVRSDDELRRQCRKLLLRHNQPVLVEEFLPGREFTVGIVGTGDECRAVGVLEVRMLKGADQDVYTFMNKELCEERISYVNVSGKRVAKEATETAVQAYRALGCRDAGRIDLRADSSGKLSFIEANPLAGLHPTHSDLPILCSKVGMSYGELIAEIVRSAVQRTSRKTSVFVRDRAVGCVI